MARINLLPWREDLRERKNREFVTQVIAVILFSLIAAFAAWTYFNRTLQNQQEANELIAAENSKLDAQLAQIETLEARREEIISRMKVIQDLQGRRPVPVRLWDDITRAIPSAMYITSLRREGDLLIFTGRADNPNTVSNLIRNLDESKWMGSAKLRFIQDNVSAYQSNITAAPSDGQIVYPENNYVNFVVTAQVVVSAPPEEENEQLAPDNQADSQANEGGE